MSIPPFARWLIARVAVLVPLLLIVSLITFSLIDFIPGDPAVALAGDSPTPEKVEAIRAQLGVDRPFWVRFTEWGAHALGGDLGNSFFSPIPVLTLIAHRIPVTLSLAGLAILIAVVLGCTLGVIAAIFRGSWIDRLVAGIASVGIAVPSFWVGMMLIYVFALQWGWLPAVGYTPFAEDPAEWLRHLILPAIAVGATSMAEIARQLRTSMVGILDEDYIRTAKANGLSKRSVFLKHALKNSAVTVVTVIGIQAAFLLGGSVIIESVFGMPGIGSLAVTAVLQRDLPVVQGIVLVTALIVLIINMLVDISYGLLNPSVRA